MQEEHDRREKAQFVCHTSFPLNSQLSVFEKKTLYKWEGGKKNAVQLSSVAVWIANYRIRACSDSHRAACSGGETSK